MVEKKLDTLVKLNPTLLGYDRVRGILSDIGYGYVELDREGFSRDLQYADAIPMLSRLQAVGAEIDRFFGIKLSNTLASHNRKGELPGGEMYLSGRALYPLTINLAAGLMDDFGGRLPVSFSGGIAAWNLRDVLESGIRPVTLATDLLKPGGYGRMKELAEIAESCADTWTMPRIDVERLKGGYYAGLYG